VFAAATIEAMAFPAYSAPKVTHVCATGGAVGAAGTPEECTCPTGQGDAGGVCRPCPAATGAYPPGRPGVQALSSLVTRAT
jgi:hypothetical protein